MSFTLEEYERIKANCARAATRSKGMPASRARTPRGRSWMPRAKPHERSEDGITFASKSELMRYRELKKAKRDGTVAWFLRQPLFDLSGVQYRADFLVVYTSGHVTVEEVKPLRAPQEVVTRWKRNYQQVLQLYGIKIVLVQF